MSVFAMPHHYHESPPVLRLTVWILVAWAWGCGIQHPECTLQDAQAGGKLSCPVPGHVDRAFDLHIPGNWDGQTPLPVIFAFHGGGGNRKAAAKVTCPDGNRSHPACLVPVAKAAGFAVVLPDGTGSRPLRNIRTWNAGGGRNGWNCTSGGACNSGVDDMKYLDDLLSAVGRVIPVDPARVHATGLSNGAAISHRWACERPEILASIVPVGGANQFEAAGGTCTHPVAVLQIHGTADPCWTYEASTKTCINTESGIKDGVPETMERWRTRNGCDGDPEVEELPDTRPDDGMSATMITYTGCTATVQLLRINGGGHTWPGGHAYLGTSRVGPVYRDIEGNPLIVEFFRAHPKP